MIIILGHILLLGLSQFLGFNLLCCPAERYFSNYGKKSLVKERTLEK